MDNTRLEGAIALVTGAHGDIGSAIARLLEQRGATGRSLAGLAKLEV